MSDLQTYLIKGTDERCSIFNCEKQFANDRSQNYLIFQFISYFILLLVLGKFFRANLKNFEKEVLNLLILKLTLTYN